MQSAKVPSPSSAGGYTFEYPWEQDYIVVVGMVGLVGLVWLVWLVGLVGDDERDAEGIHQV